MGPAWQAGKTVLDGVSSVHRGWKLFGNSFEDDVLLAWKPVEKARNDYQKACKEFTEAVKSLNNVKGSRTSYNDVLKFFETLATSSKGVMVVVNGTGLIYEAFKGAADAAKAGETASKAASVLDKVNPAVSLAALLVDGYALIDTCKNDPEKLTKELRRVLKELGDEQKRLQGMTVAQVVERTLLSIYC